MLKLDPFLLMDVALDLDLIAGAEVRDKRILLGVEAGLEGGQRGARCQREDPVLHRDDANCGRQVLGREVHPRHIDGVEDVRGRGDRGRSGDDPQPGTCRAG